MKYFGLRAYILFNIIVISTFGILIIVIISTKVTEQFAIQGRIEGTKSVIAAFESTYFKMGRTEEGIKFLESALGNQSSVYLTSGNEKYYVNKKPDNVVASQLNLDIYRNLREPKISINGTSILPFASYKSYEIIYPLNAQYKSPDGLIYIYQPLTSFQETIVLSRKLATISSFLFILLIGIFGYYILSRTVVNPIQKLIEITKGIAKGRFPENTKIGNITEINKLYDSLNSMYGEIEEKTEILEKNISELEKANNDLLDTQQQLISSEKLASLGILSAGVAHEIGNPVYSIYGYIEVLKKDSSINDQKKFEYLQKIESEVERISLIIKTLLDYSKPKDFYISDENLNDVVSEAFNILNNQGTLKNISVELELSETPLIIHVDRNQIIQVLINLIINAVDAIEAVENNTGVIKIRTQKISDQLISLKIIDNGAGIPKEYIDKIFDPFFTTKEPGKGTGLGLSICQRIIEQFNGKIKASSEEGKGTELEIIFTCVQN